MLPQKKNFILLATLLLSSPNWDAGASKSVVAQTRTHRHSQLSNVSKQVLPTLEITLVTLDKSVAKENVVRSPNGRYEAFTSYQSDQSTGFRIYFLERRTGKIYEVRGLPLAHRAFSDLVWVNNRTFVFDRWSQPHHGIHYAINVKSLKLISAAAFPD